MTDPHVLDPAHAPTPFTAADIRDGSPAGKTMTLRVEAEGAEPFLRVNRYVEVDEQGVLIGRGRATSAGPPMAPPQGGRATWLELQAHASFPAEQTTIESGDVETPMGSLACLRYTVRDGSSVR